MTDGAATLEAGISGNSVVRLPLTSEASLLSLRTSKSEDHFLLGSDTFLFTFLVACGKGARAKIKMLRNKSHGFE